LRGGRAWAARGGAWALLWPGRQNRNGGVVWAWGAGVMAAAVLLASGDRLVQVLAPAALCGAKALGQPRGSAARRQLGAVGTGIAVLGLWRFTYLSVPWFWLGADHVAGVVGRIGGKIAGQP